MIEKKIGILGAGSWATALAITLARKGLKTVLWARRADLAEEINIKRTNERYLKGVSLPSNLNCTTDLEMAVSNVDFILSVVPSHAFRNTIKQVLPMTKKDSLIINAAKGLEEDSLKRLSKVFEEEVISNNEMCIRDRDEHVRVDYDTTPHDPHDNNAYYRSRRTATNIMKNNPVALIEC